MEGQSLVYANQGLMQGAQRALNTQTDASVAAPTELSTIIARLDDLAATLAGNSNKARLIADRIVGSRGEDANKGAPTPVPNGAIATINQALERLSGLVADNHLQIDRLSNV